MKRKVATHSQHFLRNPRFIAELVGHSNVRRGDLVLDIGAGSGAITAVLARRARRVIAYEVEPRTLGLLRKNLQNYENVKIVPRDFLRASLPSEPYKVFSNIPFHLSAEIVRKLTNSERPPNAIFLILQKQFAQKLVPSDRHFTSQLGSQIAPWWCARIRRPLCKTDFTPPPAVDTVLLELKPRLIPLLDLAEHENYQRFVAQNYARQTEFAKLPRAAWGVNPERKPSELSPEDWAKLYENSQKLN